MTTPLVIDLPHSLGRDEAKRRMKARIGELAGHLPGGVGDVRSNWPSEDRMALAIRAMGQEVAANLDVEDQRIRLELALPPMLGFFSGAIETAIRAKGSELLLDDRRPR